MSGRRPIEIGPVGENVAANLVRLRTERRLSVRQLSTALGQMGRPVTASGITRIEKLKRRVDVDDLVALATALSVTPAQLLDPPTGCGTCHGTPPPGFACTECGTTTKETT